MSNVNGDSALSITPLTSNTSSSSASSQAKQGSLRVAILSCYDLPLKDPPVYVNVTVGDQNAQTGPPVQRHRDRNAFKFSTSSVKNKAVTASSSANQVSIHAPLAELYRQTLQIHVIYQDQPTQTMKTTYEINQLQVHETAWLVLDLEPVHPDAVDMPTTNDVDDWKSAEFRKPTIRLHLTLEGPYRTEIAAVMQVAKAWFGLIDAIDANVQQVLGYIPTFDAKLILIPAAPILAIMVVSLPVVLGILILGLPMFLPFLVVLSTAAGALGVSGLFFYASTRGGRHHVQSWLQPLMHTLLSTPSGQRLVYPVAPRPTPVKVAQLVLPQNMWGKLMVSLLIDAAGSASYLLPLVGEGLDIVWAPMQTILVAALYDATSPHLKYLSFVEEILPLTDVVPTATLGWLLEYGVPVVAQQLGLGGDEKTMEISLIQ